MSRPLTPRSVSEIFHMPPPAVWTAQLPDDPKRATYEQAWNELNRFNSIDEFITFLKELSVTNDLDQADEIDTDIRLQRRVYLEFRPRTRVFVPRVLEASVTARDFRDRADATERVVLISPLKFRQTDIQSPVFEYVKRFNVADSDHDDAPNFADAAAQPLLVNMMQRALFLSEANKRILDGAAGIIPFRPAHFQPGFFQPIANLPSLGPFTILRQARNAWFNGLFKTFTYFFGRTNNLQDVVSLLAATNLNNGQRNAANLLTEIARITQHQPTTPHPTFDKEKLRRLGSDLLRVDSSTPNINITFRAHILVFDTETGKTTVRQPIFLTFAKRNAPTLDQALAQFNSFVDDLTPEDMQITDRETPLPGSDRVQGANEQETWTRFVSVDMTHVNFAVGHLTKKTLTSLISVVKGGSNTDDRLTFNKKQDHALSREVVTITVGDNDVTLQTVTDPTKLADCVVSAFTLALRNLGHKIRLADLMHELNIVSTAVSTDASSLGMSLQTINGVADFVATKFGLRSIIVGFNGDVLTANGDQEAEIKILYHDGHAFAITQASPGFISSIAAPQEDPSFKLEVDDQTSSAVVHLDFETVCGPDVSRAVLPYALSFTIDESQPFTFIEEPSNISADILFKHMLDKIIEVLQEGEDGWRHVTLSAFNGDKFDFNLLEVAMLDAGFKPRGSVSFRVGTRYFNMPLRVSFGFSDLMKWSMTSLAKTFETFVRKDDRINVPKFRFFKRERDFCRRLDTTKVAFDHSVPQSAFNDGQFMEWAGENERLIREYVEQDVRLLRVCFLKFKASFYDRKCGMFPDLPTDLQDESAATAAKWGVKKRRDPDARGLRGFLSYPSIASANFARASFVTSCGRAFDPQMQLSTLRTFTAMVRDGAQAGRVSSDMFGVKVEATLPKEKQICTLPNGVLCSTVEGRFVFVAKKENGRFGLSDKPVKQVSNFPVVSGPLRQIDIVSSYPSQMTSDLPCGKATIVQGDFVEEALKECQRLNRFFFVTALINPAPDVAKFGQCMSAFRDSEDNGRLKYKHAGEYIRFTNNIELRNITSWSLPTGEQIFNHYEKVFAAGDYVHDVGFYSGGPVLVFWERSEPVLKSYIEYLVNEKSEAKSRGDTVAADFAKLKVNSISGKMFERVRNEEVFDIFKSDLSSFSRAISGFANPFSDFLNIRGRVLGGLADRGVEKVVGEGGDALRHRLIDVVRTGENFARVRRVDVMAPDSSPVWIGALIYSLGREMLWVDGFERGPVWYTDTDSLVLWESSLIDLEEENPDWFGSDLGCWEKEGGLIDCIWSIAPKTYCLRFMEGTHKTAFKTRAKGLSERRVYTVDGVPCGTLLASPAAAFDAVLDPERTVRVGNLMFGRNWRDGAFQFSDQPKVMKLTHVDEMNVRGGFESLVKLTVGRL